MMLYEKALSRKVIGTSTQPREEVSSTGMDDGGPRTETKRPKFQLNSIWGGLYGAITRVFDTANEPSKESKKPASMGKILNMMRHVSLTVRLSVTN